MAHGIWRTIALSLITLLIGAAGTWGTIGSDKVTRAEVEKMIQTQAPSAVELNALRDEIVLLKIEQARTTEKLDLLLKKQGVR